MTSKKRDLVTWIGVYLGLLAFAAVLLVAMGSKAHAADYKRTMMKRDSWGMIRKYTAPNQVGTGSHIESYTVSILTDYLWWPDGDNVGKLTVVKFQVCYDRNTGNGTLFQGVSANPVYRDDTDAVLPGGLTVGDDGDGHHCVARSLENSELQWLRMDQDPRWFATGKVHIAYFPDDDFNFLWGGEQRKFFHPLDDPNLWDDWGYCECDWGGATH